MPRFDLFTSIHKSLRAMIYETGGALQTTDFADERSARRAVDGLEPVLRSLQEHHDIEETFVFPEVRPFEPQLVDHLQAQHHEVQRLLGAAGEALGACRTAGAADRMGAGADLNRRFNELAAFYLEHLAHEEASLLPATWKHFDDPQLMAIQGSIMSSMPPAQLLQSLEWMFKGLNRAELVGLLGGAKASVPAPALEAIKTLGAETMEQAAWEVVREQAGL
jgi:hemerythrin-like domain-containing protein